MFTRYGQCVECVAEGYFKGVPIVNNRHKLCDKHNKVRLSLQQSKPKKSPSRIVPRRFSETFQYCKEWDFVREMDMFHHIWLTRPHVSYFTGKPIFYFHPWNFIHVLPKGLGKYPHYRLNPNNVVLGLKREHDLVDVGTQALREKYKKENPNYNIEAYYQLYEELKKEYQDRDFS